MQTVDVRVLLPDDVDVERFVERLGRGNRHHEVLGAVSVEFGCEPNGEYTEDVGCVYSRDDVAWNGNVIYLTSIRRVNDDHV